MELIMIVTNVLPCPSPLYLEKLGSSIFVVIFILSLTLFTITISTFFKSRLYLGNVKYSYEKKKGGNSLKKLWCCVGGRV